MTLKSHTISYMIVVSHILDNMMVWYFKLSIIVMFFGTILNTSIMFTFKLLNSNVDYAQI